MSASNILHRLLCGPLYDGGIYDIGILNILVPRAFGYLHVLCNNNT